MKDKINLIPCPPLSLYETQPRDQSLSEIVDCPHCNKKMWLSEKKKSLIKNNPHKITLLCYFCIESELRNLKIKEFDVINI